MVNYVHLKLIRRNLKQVILDGVQLSRVCTFPASLEPVQGQLLKAELSTAEKFLNWTSSHSIFLTDKTIDVRWNEYLNKEKRPPAPVSDAEAERIWRAYDPETPLDVMREIVRNGSVEDKQRVAQNPSIHGEFLDELAGDESELVREIAARHPSMLPTTLARLSEDNDGDVRCAVARHPSTQVEIVRFLSKDANNGVRDEIAGRPDLPLDVIESLSNDPNKGTRTVIASNSATPGLILARLADDEDGTVRWYVAQNQKTTQSAIKKLRNDPDESIRRYAAKNPGTPDDSVKAGDVLYMELQRSMNTVEEWIAKQFPAGEKFAAPNVSGVVQPDITWDNGAPRVELRDSDGNKHFLNPFLTTLTRDGEAAQEISNGIMQLEKHHDQVGYYRSLVFEHVGMWQIEPDSKVGRMISVLISVCERGAPFLDPRDAKRHLWFLNHLTQFKVPTYQDGNGRAMIPAIEIGVTNIGSLLDRWVMSFFEEGYTGLHPHYALDTAEFVRALLFGYEHCGTKNAAGEREEGWKIEPLLDEKQRRGERGPDKRFKRDFTMSIDLTVRATVPQNTTVLNKWKNEVLLTDGDEFELVVTRCHLSESLDDQSSLAVKETAPKKPTIVLGTKFQLFGRFRVNVPNSPRNQSGPLFALPPQWITHEVVSEGYGKEPRLIPVPTWELEAPAAGNTLKVILGGRQG
jgi:hypothetical protein